MDSILEILKEPFVLGLLLGLLITAFVWKTGFTKAQHLKKDAQRLNDEMSELQGHLNTQLKINASGNEALNQELKELKEHNENLRVNLSTLQQKPDKAELKHLHITENAVRLMREQAPGFASAWEKALRASEEEYEKSQSGLTKLVRKVLPNYGSSTAKDVKTIEVQDEKEEG